MLTNDIKKGTKVLLKSGWEAFMMDNKKGNIRLMDVEGPYREIGSVYAWDISAVYDETFHKWFPVTITDKQLKARGY